METTALLIDGLIVVLYFVLIVAIGLYAGRKEKTLEDYALGGRNIPWWAVAASIIAAETSAATFIGAPAEGFKCRGLVYAQITLGLLFGRIFVGQVFLKPYYVYRVYTVYDFLTVRFGPRSKNYVSILFLIMRTLASGVRLYIPSLVLVLAWRLFVQHREVRFATLDSWVPYAWAILILIGITCAYTAIGGIKAVIWTDVIQASLMIAAAVVAAFALLFKIGDGSLVHGFTVLGQHVPEMKSLKGYVLTGMEEAQPGMGAWEVLKLLFVNPYTLPATLIGGTVGAIAAFGTDQDMVQRMLTAKDVKRSRRSLIAAALMAIPIAGAFTFIGVLLIAFFDLNPHLKPKAPNDVFGAYILQGMPVVIRGFVLASIFATAMGSLSAALNSLATSATNDWYVPYFARKHQEGHYVNAARAFTGLFSVLLMAVAVAAAYANVSNPRLTILPLALGIPGYFLGPMLGVFLLGMLTKKRGSDTGNVIAVTAGLAAVFVLSGTFPELVGKWHGWPDGIREFLARMPRVGFTWYQLIGASATLLVGLLFRTPEHVVENAMRKASEGSVH